VRSTGKVSAPSHLPSVADLKAAAQYGHTVVAHHPSASPPSLTMLSQLEYPVRSTGKASARLHLPIVAYSKAAAQYGHTVIAHHPSASPPSLTMLKLRLESLCAICRKGECSSAFADCY
jgi:hypothetical protein